MTCRQYLFAALLGAIVLASDASPSDPVERRPWGPEQALGSPDTESAGDRPTAWASRTKDGRVEWLELQFPRAVVPLAVRVFETFNPGAVREVVLLPAEGGSRTGWEGEDPTPVTAERGVSLIPLVGEVPIRDLRLVLDSPRVEGWNEIDAVLLHGVDGSAQWASRARASSTYARGASSAAGEPQFIDEPTLDADQLTAAEPLLELYRAARREPLPDAAVEREARRRILDALAMEIVAAQRHGDRSRRAVGFTGSWETSYGRMRLDQSGAAVEGIYAHRGGARIEGQFEGERLVFRYTEPDAAGEGWFELAADGGSFEGQWRPDGEESWRPWTGRRATEEGPPGAVWLVVLEARWESSVADPEYSFGGMLRSLFAGSENVRFRHRFFHDADDFGDWCHEIAYLEGPIYLVIATHGTEEALQVRSETVSAEQVAAALEPIRSLRLVHFSACEAMGGAIPDEILARRRPGDPLKGVSGYDVSVDWMVSAITEFLYLDLMLNRGLEPDAAAAEVLRSLPFAGTRPVPGGILPAAHFRFRAAAGE